MNVENPVPATASLLVVALPGLWLAGRLLASKAVNDRRLALLISPGLALAGWLLSLHVSGLATGSFHTALWIGTLAPAVAGLAGSFWMSRHRGASPGVDSWQPSKWMWIGAAATMAVISPLALRWAFHDELFLTGHMSITASIQNGSYPPRYPSFPAYELRYHYGFPLLTAAITSLFRLRTDHGIDLITIFCSGYLFTLLWAVGDRMLGHGRGWMTAVVTLFGGGIPFFCRLADSSVAHQLIGYCAVSGVFPNPPLVSYFFQHPWTIGLPFAAILMLLGTATASWQRLLAIGLLLVTLSLSQIVLFATLGGAIIASEMVRRDVSVRNRTAMLATALIVVAISTRLGGFFADRPPQESPILTLQVGAADDLLGSVLWNLGTLGLLLPAGLIGIVFAGRFRTIAATLALAGLLVVNLVQYTHSWDIVKFGAVAALGLSIAASAALSHLIDLRPRHVARMAGAALVAGFTAATMIFMGALALVVPGLPEDAYGRRPAPYTADEARAMTWLRHNVSPGELVYRNSGNALAFAQWAGLSEPWHDPMLERFGAPPSLAAQRSRLLRTLPDDSRQFADEEIVWFVIRRDGSRPDTLTGKWVEERRAVVRDTFGELRIIQLAVNRASD